MRIAEIKPNPNNPRIIKDDKFKKLVKSIQDFPQMLELRPIVIDENNVVLGGNMPWENAEDRIKHGTQLRGIQIAKSVLTEEAVREIKSYIPVWNGRLARKFAKQFGVSGSTITDIIVGKTWSIS